jgi:hypothetical protein
MYNDLESDAPNYLNIIFKRFYSNLIHLFEEFLLARVYLGSNEFDKTYFDSKLRCWENTKDIFR